MASIIAHSSPIITDSSEYDVGKYYYFYKSTTRPPSLYQNILAGAKKRIDIWDPYFDITSAKLFENITQDNITINILTKIDTNNNENSERQKIHSYIDEIKSVIQGMNPKISVVYYGGRGNCIEVPKLWHDRYLLIDNKIDEYETDVYLVGASTNRIASICNSFGICQLSEQTDKDIVINQLAELQEKYVFHGGKRISK